MNELRAKYRHPLWRESGEIAKKMGGHGGMDFLMDLRLCYCLQNGLPLDINVYESCQWSVLETVKLNLDADKAKAGQQLNV